MEEGNSAPKPYVAGTASVEAPQQPKAGHGSGSDSEDEGEAVAEVAAVKQEASGAGEAQKTESRQAHARAARRERARSLAAMRARLEAQRQGKSVADVSALVDDSERRVRRQSVSGTPATAAAPSPRSRPPPHPRSQRASSVGSVGAGAGGARMVMCPVCHRAVREEGMLKHLEACLPRLDRGAYWIHHMGRGASGMVDVVVRLQMPWKLQVEPHARDQAVDCEPKLPPFDAVCCRGCARRAAMMQPEEGARPQLQRGSTQDLVQAVVGSF